MPDSGALPGQSYRDERGHRLFGCAKRGCDAINPDWRAFGAHGKSWCLHHRPLRARLRVWWQEHSRAW
jgi:hypothetical protein